MPCALALFAALRVAEPAPAAELPAPPGDVQWEAPASCPTEAAVVAAIAVRVPLGLVRVEARVREATDGFAAEVAIDSAHGTTARTLASPSCTSIVDALALLAHVAAEPLPTPEIIAPAPVPVREPIGSLPEDLSPLPPVAAAPSAPQPRPQRRAPRQVHATMAAVAVVGGGTLPTIDLGVLGTAGLAHRVGRVEIGMLYLGRRRPDLDVDVRVEVDAWGLALRVCPAIARPQTRPALELGVCAGGYAGRLRGGSRGDDLDAPRAAAQPWVRIAAGPELALALHRRVRVTAALEFGGHVVRPGFGIGGIGRVWASQRWGAHGLAGLQVRL